MRCLEEQNFLTFRNESVKPLSGMQYKAEECKRQVPTTPQAQVTTFQVPEPTQATTGLEIILMIPDTQQVSPQLAVKPSQVSAPQPPTLIVKLQPQRSQQSSSSSLSSSLSTSFLVVDDQ